MTVLLDGSVLIAIGLSTHEHHDRAAQWFAAQDAGFATCPITQGTMLRALLRAGSAVLDAVGAMESLTGHERHEFWPDDGPYDTTVLRGVVGHRQVTDAYLAALARARGGRLATLDNGLAVTHRDVVDLVPPTAEANEPTRGRV